MKRPRSKLTLRELTPQEIPAIQPLIEKHNPGLGRAMFTRRLKEMLPHGYRVLAAFDGDRMAAISGFWIGMRFWSGREFDIDNFIVDDSYRAAGLGARMLAWLEKKSLEEQCELMVLDVYAHSFLAHRFYFRHGFVMTGHHMTKIPGSREPFMPRRYVK